MHQYAESEIIHANCTSSTRKAILAVAGYEKCLTKRSQGIGVSDIIVSFFYLTDMDSEKRTLLQVSIEDSVQADEIFTILMGDQVEPRKDFIVKHALEARNIDI
jgi:DNA gyrase/topoisomerase IV subunit B